MNIEEILDEDSSSDDFAQVLKGKKQEVPEEFSIDNLLKARVNENSYHNTPKREKKDETISRAIPNDEKTHVIINVTSGTTTTTTDDDYHDTSSFPIIDRDGSVFEFSQSSAPVEVFTLLEKNESPNEDLDSILSNIPIINQWQYKSLQFHPELVEISSEILFSSIYRMIMNRDKKIGEIIIKYWNRFPNDSIEYFFWYYLIKKSIYSKNFDVTIILLSISDLEKFTYENDEEREKAPFDIIVLNFYAILCPEIAENPNYCHVLSVFKKSLVDVSQSFSEKQIEELIDICYSISSDCDSRNYSYLISLFPLDGLGCELIIQVMMRLCLMCLRIFEFPENITVEFVVNSMSEIKKLCESLTTEDLINASAAMALSEKIIMIAIKMKDVKSDLIETMAKNMKFSINCSNPGVLTALKEQIHVTRSQFDCFLQAHFH